jgi:taurine dioxygenase
MDLDTPKSEFSARPLSGSIGAEITGVELRGLSAAVLERIKSVFLNRSMIVIRGQSLAPPELLAFSQLWGKVSITPMLKYQEGLPGVLLVSNTGKSEVVTENWHSDSSFVPRPPAITILAAEELPSAGGDTMWSNQYLAYETLSEGMKQLLTGVRAKFCGTRIARVMKDDREVPYAFHPVVRTHPETGRKALFVGNPGETALHFENMTVEESLPLLTYLYTHSASPDQVYRHRWMPGDVVMWDNRCTMHYAVHDYGDAVRTLHRCTIEGDEPR